LRPACPPLSGERRQRLCRRSIAHARDGATPANRLFDRRARLPVPADRGSRAVGQDLPRTTQSECFASLGPADRAAIVQGTRTPPSHGGNPGSNPGSGTPKTPRIYVAFLGERVRVEAERLQIRPRELSRRRLQAGPYGLHPRVRTVKDGVAHRGLPALEPPLVCSQRQELTSSSTHGGSPFTVHHAALKFRSRVWYRCPRARHRGSRLRGRSGPTCGR
jgi:hypothetical protein